MIADSSFLFISLPIVSAAALSLILLILSLLATAQPLQVMCIPSVTHKLCSAVCMHPKTCDVSPAISPVIHRIKYASRLLYALGGRRKVVNSRIMMCNPV